MLTLSARFLKSVGDLASEPLVRCWAKHNGCTIPQLAISWLCSQLNWLLGMAFLLSLVFAAISTLSIYKKSFDVGYWPWIPAFVFFVLFIYSVYKQAAFEQFCIDVQSVKSEFGFDTQPTSESVVPASFVGLHNGFILLIHTNEQKMDDVTGLNHDQRAEAVAQRGISKQKIQRLMVLSKKFTDVL